MKLKLIVSDINEVDEKFRELYTKQDDGSYRMDIEGATPKSKVDEMRNNNIEITNKNAELQKQVEELNSAIEAAKKSSSGSNDTVVKALEARVNELQKASEMYQSQIKGMTIQQQAQRAYLQSGCEESGIDYAMYQIEKVFSLDENGQVVAKDKDGNVILSEKNPTQGLTIEEFVSTNLKKSSPFLFPSASGGGAKGAKSGGAAFDGPNPYANGDLDLQYKLEKTNPSLAASLEAEAKA